jgi:uncharacterized protein
LLLLLIGILWLPISAHSQVPECAGRVTDPAGVLSARENARLTRMLASYEKETRHQIAVLIIPGLGGESIESYSLRVANTWGIGHKDLDNGILVVLAVDDRKVRIELGLGFERYISDARAAEIIQRDMIPSFRKEKYARGLERGLTQLMRDGRKFVVKGD